jgi:DNA helicase-2/ATP-dependent DNA helicase PcrA
MSKLSLVLGGPGCGKTTRLLQLVTEELASGTPPERIAFVAFTRAAATEARERAKAIGMPEDRLTWFRTIHSLAYQCLGLTRDEVMDRGDWKEFARIVGEPINERNRATLERYAGNASRGDKMLRVVDYAATTMMSLPDSFQLLGEGFTWHEVKRFDDALRSFKGSVAKLDFSDMILTYIAEGEPIDVKVAIIDEAQDLTMSQWKLVERAFSRAERVYVGGDDDQSIYYWAGADTKRFLSLDAAREVLPVSHRLPPNIHAYSQQIARRISARYEKNFKARDGDDGVIEWHQAPGDIWINRHESWLLLARNGYLLADWEAHVRSQGLPYTTREGDAIKPEEREAILNWTWMAGHRESVAPAKTIRAFCALAERPRPSLKEFQTYHVRDFLDNMQPWHRVFSAIPRDRCEYYLACMMRGTFIAESRIRIETIHGVKGAEADNVALRTDISWRTAEAMAVEADPEHRVFYVGVTRARKALHLVAPQGNSWYDLPSTSGVAHD